MENKECKRCGFLKSTIDAFPKTKCIPDKRMGTTLEGVHDFLPMPTKSICDCSTKYCRHYESDFDKYVKENPIFAINPMAVTNEILEPLNMPVITRQGENDRVDEILVKWGKEQYFAGYNAKKADVRAFSKEQLEYIARQEKQCLESECDDTGHKHD